MRVVLIIAGAFAAAAAGGFARADPSTRIIEIIGEKQSEAGAGADTPTVVVTKKKSCGSKLDSFFCGKISRTASGSLLSYATPGMAVTAEKGASVVVTWSGNLYCEMRAEPVAASADPSRVEFVVDLAIQDGLPGAIEPNEEGSTRIGTRERLAGNHVDPATSAAFDYYPVLLTRTFVKRKSGVETYFVNAVGDVRAGYGSCTISGGAMTAVAVSG